MILTFNLKKGLNIKGRLLYALLGTFSYLFVVIICSDYFYSVPFRKSVYPSLAIVWWNGIEFISGAIFCLFGSWQVVNVVSGKFLAKEKFYLIFSLLIFLLWFRPILIKYLVHPQIAEIKWGFNAYSLFEPLIDDQNSGNLTFVIPNNTYDKEGLSQPYPFEKAGLQAGDKVIRVFDRDYTIENTALIKYRYQKWLTIKPEIRPPIPLVIERGEKQYEILLPVNTEFSFWKYLLYENRDPLQFFKLVIIWLVGLVFLILGAIVFLHKSEQFESQLFGMAALCIAIFLLFISLEEGGYDVISLPFEWFGSLTTFFLGRISKFLMPALVLHFLLIFPKPKLVYTRYSILPYLIYTMPLIIKIISNFVLPAGKKGSYFMSQRSMLIGYYGDSPSWLIGTFIIIIRSYAHRRNLLTTKELKT